MMWDVFDEIVVIVCSKYSERVAPLRKELNRVGLLERCIFQWDVGDPFVDFLASKLIFRTSAHKKWFRCGYNHYCAIKKALALGRKSILLLEDDIRFLKDKGKINEAICSIPTDYHIAMLDKAWPQNQVGRCDNISFGWKPFSVLHSSGCYAMSHEGMKRWIRAYEEGAFRTWSLDSNDQYFSLTSLGQDAKLYHYSPNIAIQMISGKEHLSLMDRYYENHQRQGLMINNYNIDFPIVTRYNFETELYNAIDKQTSIFDISDLEVVIPTDSHQNLLRSVFGGKGHIDEHRIFAIWGNTRGCENIKALQEAVKEGNPILLCEDGFIRSVDTWVGVSEKRFQESHSLIYDSAAYYFDGVRVSSVEKMLNDKNLIILASQRAEAHCLIDKIVSNKISKYNHQPIFTPKIGREGVRKVLVVDQSYGDFSIKRGMADDSTFEKMLQAAINENPDADILVKTHPDTLAGKKAEKKGYYQDLKEHDNIYKVTFPINPYSLMELCDKVYVCSSQFGLEALMAGKEVHVFGMPFYAGWGLTIDDQHLERRTNKRTLEELFYIFYCMYTHWVDPDKGCETTIDAVIDKMIKLREEYQKNPHEAIRAVATPSVSDDGFGYVRRSPSVRTPFVPQPNPPISSRSSIKVLPRIGSTKRGYCNW